MREEGNGVSGRGKEGEGVEKLGGEGRGERDKS